MASDKILRATTFQKGKHKLVNNEEREKSSGQKEMNFSYGGACKTTCAQAYSKLQKRIQYLNMDLQGSPQQYRSIRQLSCSMQNLGQANERHVSGIARSEVRRSAKALDGVERISSDAEEEAS